MDVVVSEPILTGPVHEVRAYGPNARLILRMFISGLQRFSLTDTQDTERWLHAAQDSVPPGMMLRVHGKTAELVVKPRRRRGLSAPLAF